VATSVRDDGGGHLKTKPWGEALRLSLRLCVSV
jgi:hypothetical protein